MIIPSVSLTEYFSWVIIKVRSDLNKFIVQNKIWATLLVIIMQWL